MAFKQWRWWKKYRPSWGILNWGNLQIAFDGNNYHMELNVDMKFSNGNDRYEAQYAGINSYFWIDVYHEGKGWEKPPYRLWEKDFLPQKTLQPSGFEQTTLVFETKTDVPAKPFIGNTANCKIGGEIYGEIQTPHVSLWGKLKNEGNNKSKVNVAWELENDTN